MIKFYDTSSLLRISLDCLTEHFVISSITLKELEDIKTSNRDSNIKYKARHLLHFLAENQEKYSVWIFNISMLAPILEKDLPINDDAKILASAIDYEKAQAPDEMIFVTDDLCLYNIANLFFGFDSIEKLDTIFTEDDQYTGYEEVALNEKEMAEFYSSYPSQNLYNLKPNQYLVIRDTENKVVDLRVWTGDNYRYLTNESFNSKWFGKVKPFQNDIYQKMAIDSLHNNQLTVLRGPAGSGKSYLGFSYLFSLLETGNIDKIFMFCNTVATKDSAKLGYYPGDKNAKLLDSQIGNFLVSKLGDIYAAEDLVSKGKIILVPASDCRGMDLGENVGVYITEAQNSTIDLMKLMVQRIGENTKCVIEGDDKAQVDLDIYSGKNNGLARLSEVFRGQDFYGEIQLNQCYRSKIARIAENF